MSARRCAAFVLTAALALLACTASVSADSPIPDASFESPGEMPAGWRLSQGARSANGPDSHVVVDRETAADGTSSLQLSGDASTGSWFFVSQDVAVHGLDRVTLRVKARCRGVKREGAQFANANATLALLSATGRRYVFEATPVLTGDHDWTEFVIDTLAPHGTVTAQVGLFLSMTGTVWFDDVRLDVVPSATDDADGRARAFDALAGHLRRTYPFFGLAAKPQADALFARHRAKAVAAGRDAAFVAEIRAMLAELDDIHVTVVAQSGWSNDFHTSATARRFVDPPNWNAAAIEAAITTKSPAPTARPICGRIGEGPQAVGYLHLYSFLYSVADFEKLLDQMGDVNSLILDVRDNSGGDESLAARIAGRFTDHDVVYARASYRDPFSAATDAFCPPVDRMLKPATPGKCDARRVAVLQGPYCVSSTEAFLLMMRALPNVTTIGQTSRGASGNPAPFDVAPGLTVWTSRWRSLTPDGECIEGRGIAPTIVVEGSHAKSDPTLERALTELRR